MSALTNLFTALANKIRSKTGGSDTYTPPQMVNAIDDVYQAGVNAGTTPTQTKTVTAGTSATTVTPDTGYALSSVTVNPTPTETKSDTPNVSTNKTVSPSSGKHLSQVTIQPLTHSGTYTPAANTAQNDMGAYHDKRYVNTSGMIVPSGNKSITANGTGIDVSSYATANVNVPNPTLSGNATAADVKSGKTFYNSDYTKRTGTYVEPTINNITPQNDSAPPLTSGSVYQPSTDGYAIKTFKNVTPRNSYPYSVQVGDMAHIETNDGYVVATEPIEIKPLSTSPPHIDTNKLYKPTNSGYAIDSYPTSVTPTADGTYFSTGVKSMSQPGWAYSEKPELQEITLWSNTSPTSTFTGKTINLNSGCKFSDYSYIKIYYRVSTTNAAESAQAITLSDFIKNTSLKANGQYLTLATYGTSNQYVRWCYYVSDTQMYITQGYSQSYSIPTKIVGIK